MTMASAPHAPDGERWFCAIDPQAGSEGVWHLGPTRPGTTWPVRRARCGYAQPDIAVGRQHTAASITTRVENLCPTCVEAARGRIVDPAIFPHCARCGGLILGDAAIDRAGRLIHDEHLNGID